VRKLDASFGYLLGALAIAGALLILVMVGVVTVDVAMRAILRRGLEWSSEVSEYGVYLVTLLVAPQLLRKGLHVRIDILSSRVPGAAGVALGKLVDACGAVVCLTIAVYGFSMVQQSLAAGSMVIRNVIFPEWIAMAPLPVAFLVLAIEFVFGLFRGHGQPAEATMP
jgi:TRAP-type C4-dicarboxylate transport system permease small subunit